MTVCGTSVSGPQLSALPAPFEMGDGESICPKCQGYVADKIRTIQEELTALQAVSTISVEIRRTDGDFLLVSGTGASCLLRRPTQ